MFSAYGGDAKAWPSLGGLPVLSPCLLFSLQPRSFLSAPKRGITAWAVPLWSRHSCLLSVPRSSWRRGLCSAPLADKAMPGAQHLPAQSWAPKQTPALGDETRSNPDIPWGCLMLPPCSCCRAGHNFPEPGKRRMQPPGFRYLPNPLQQSQVHSPSPKSSTKTLNSSPFPAAEHSWR